MLIIGVIAAAIGIVVALVIPWFPANGSRQAGNIRTLYDVLLIVSVPIFVLVETVVLYSVWKFRMRPGEERKDGPPIHGNTRLEVVWTAFPAILILALCSYAYTVLRSNEDSPEGRDDGQRDRAPVRLRVLLRRRGRQADRLTRPCTCAKGQPVVFKLRSLDVIHSFFVPEFSQKLDAVPGITTTVRVTPTRLGTYPAECTELCGAGHSLMRATVHVVTPQAFQTWLQRPEGQRPAADRHGAGQRGAGRRTRRASGCAGRRHLRGHGGGQQRPRGELRWRLRTTSGSGSNAASGSGAASGGRGSGASAASIAAGKAVFTGARAAAAVTRWPPRARPGPSARTSVRAIVR